MLPSSCGDDGGLGLAVPKQARAPARQALPSSFLVQEKRGACAPTLTLLFCSQTASLDAMGSQLYSSVVDAPGHAYTPIGHAPRVRVQMRASDWLHSITSPSASREHTHPNGLARSFQVRSSALAAATTSDTDSASSSSLCPIITATSLSSSNSQPPQRHPHSQWLSLTCFSDPPS